MFRCLLVAADKQARDCVKVGLEQAGAFEVDTCEDSWATEMAKAKPYELVVADATLGDGGDGVDFLRRVREILPDAELLLISRNKSESRYLVRDKQQLGIYAFVHCPIDAVEFYKTIARLMERLADPSAAPASTAA